MMFIHGRKLPSQLIWSHSLLSFSSFLEVQVSAMILLKLSLP